MTEFIQVTTTTNNRQDAEQISQELVARRLAGCVQVSGPITSTYRWQGAIETAEEWLCIIKTSHNKLDSIQQVFRAIHPYEIPELIATPIVDGGESYLNWLREQLSD